jgi:superfamily II DNA or RNA helicase
MNYASFLESKRRVYAGDGLTSNPSLSATLFPFQSAITRWALRKGRCAIFADTGLGKSFMQVSWAAALDVPTLLLAPLCVAEQTVAEATKLGIRVDYAEHKGAIVGPLTITNYERLDRFDPDAFGAVVLDESGILKAFDGKTRTRLIEAFRGTRYRLCCTATPAPNDIAELANHAEFLGLMTRAEFLATWFVHDDEGWRMKKHARKPFFRWLASWACAVRTPSDLGFSDDGYILPPLTIQDQTVMASAPPVGLLFHDMAAKGIQGRMAARCASIPDRVAAAVEIASKPGQWLVWCGLNEESGRLTRAIPGAVEISGRDSYLEKKAAIRGFQDGSIRVLVTKLKVAGFGLNFQNCHQMLFVGIGDSYEQYYQGVRRCWRFGQTEPVDVTIIVSEAETGVVANVRKKEQAAIEMSRELLSELRDFEREEIAV